MFDIGLALKRTRLVQQWARCSYPELRKAGIQHADAEWSAVWPNSVQQGVESGVGGLSSLPVSCDRSTHRRQPRLLGPLQMWLQSPGSSSGQQSVLLLPPCGSGCMRGMGRLASQTSLPPLPFTSDSTMSDSSTRLCLVWGCSRGLRPALRTPLRGRASSFLLTASLSDSPSPLPLPKRPASGPSWPPREGAFESRLPAPCRVRERGLPPHTGSRRPLRFAPGSVVGPSAAPPPGSPPGPGPTAPNGAAPADHFAALRGRSSGPRHWPP